MYVLTLTDLIRIRGYSYKENELKEKRNHFELAGGSSYQGLSYRDSTVHGLGVFDL